MVMQITCTASRQKPKNASFNNTFSGKIQLKWHFKYYC